VDLKVDPHVGIAPLKLRYGALDRRFVRHVVPAPGMVRGNWNGADAEQKEKKQSSPEDFSLHLRYSHPSIH
jgi:hypothetical protein